MNLQLKVNGDNLTELIIERWPTLKPKWKTYFLYWSFPTKWRQNWRQIRGFKIHAGHRTITLAYWGKVARRGA